MTTSSSRKTGRGEAGHIRGEGPKTSETSLDSTGDVKWAPRNVGARFGGLSSGLSRIAPPLFLRSTIFSQSTPSHHRGYHCWTDERSPPVETCGRFGGRLGCNAVHVRVDRQLKLGAGRNGIVVEHREGSRAAGLDVGDQQDSVPGLVDLVRAADHQHPTPRHLHGDRRETLHAERSIRWPTTRASHSPRQALSSVSMLSRSARTAARSRSRSRSRPVPTAVGGRSPHGPRPPRSPATGADRRRSRARRTWATTPPGPRMNSSMLPVGCGLVRLTTRMRSVGLVNTSRLDFRVRNRSRRALASFAWCLRPSSHPVTSSG